MAGKPVGIVSMEEFVHELEQHADDPMMGFLLAYTAVNRHIFSDAYPMEDCEGTVEALRRVGFEWEHPTAQYISYCAERIH